MINDNIFQDYQPELIFLSLRPSLDYVIDFKMEHLMSWFRYKNIRKVHLNSETEKLCVFVVFP